MLWAFPRELKLLLCYALNLSVPWASCQIRNVVGRAYVGNAGNVSPPPLVSDLDMHHGTLVTHVQRCMPGSRTSGFLWSRRWGKRSRHSWRMHNSQFTYLVRGQTWISKISLPLANDSHCIGRIVFHQPDVFPSHSSAGLIECRFSLKGTINFRLFLKQDPSNQE